MQVEFSKIAKQTLKDNIEFLENTWSNREIVHLLIDIKKVTENLESGHYKQYQKSVRKTRSALIGKKHIRMFFRKESHSQILILLFFDMRQDPNKILDFLK